MAFRINYRILWIVLILFFIGEFSTVLAQAQPEQPPELLRQRPQAPMQNVFFNVLWGSVTGGVLLAGWTAIDDSKPAEERFTLSHMSKQFLVGATWGGFLGLAAGVYLSIKGITFDENRSRIVFLPQFKTNSQPLHYHANAGQESGINDLQLMNLQIKF